MFWTMYDKGTGGTPVIGDKVETCHLGDSMKDGEVTGTFAGWATFDRIAGIVILSEPMKTGELAVAMPVVCLRKIDR